MSVKQLSVLFVCMGNICRSPTAEGVFRSIVDKNTQGDKTKLNIHIDSAGTHAYHIGEPPDSRATATARHFGVDLSTQTARKVTLQDFVDFDYIIAMDKENLANLRSLSAKAKVSDSATLHCFMEFAKNWQNNEVPDPYYGGNDGFKDVYKMIMDASIGLLETIENKHG